ncbi:LuxR C-terminal-related transcriptional regulator [Gordonia sp. CPCC 206044]
MALARLAARRMPLPPVGSSTEARDPRRGRQPDRTHAHMHLVVDEPAPTTPRPVPPPPPLTPPPGQEDRPRPELTQREVQVIRTWLLTDSKILVAQELNISVGTVNTHLTRIRAKYAGVGRTARTKASLAARAIQDGLLSLDEL